MSETQTVQPDASAVPPARRKRPWLTAVLLLAVFLCGLVCGGGAATLVIVRGVRNAIRHPELRPERQAKWLAARLRLDAGQREQVRKILAEQDADFTALWLEVRPRVAARIEKAEAEVDQILTPEQQPKLHEIVQRFRGEWLPKPSAPQAK